MPKNIHVAGFNITHVEELFTMPIYCDNCGFQNRDSAAFCQGCGGKIIATTSQGTLQPGVILNENYEIKLPIKQGGMGVIYLAIDHRFDTDCAIKELVSQYTDQEEQKYIINSFKREAKLLRNLRHLNIPVVLDYFIEAGRYYIVMDYIEGKDLENVMKSYPNNIVPESTVLEWAKQILDALDYIHSQNPPIIYRDMKPANIMLRSSDNKIMLVDFGIAKTLLNKGQTSKSIIMGTPEFAPKELFYGQAEPRSDIYALGATIHCLLTGKFPLAPFDFKPVRNVNPKVSEGIEKVIMKALSMDIAGRYNSAREMKEALLSLSSFAQTLSKPQPVVVQSQINQLGINYVKCPDCNTINIDGNVFCDDCGKSLIELVNPLEINQIMTADKWNEKGVEYVNQDKCEEIINSIVTTTAPIIPTVNKVSNITTVEHDKNKLAGRYYLVQKIGKGVMGEVYKAKDLLENRIVAVKLLHSHLQFGKYISRFKREAEYLSKLSHPNIVKFYSLEQDEQNIFLVMEYIVGKKIRSYIKLSAAPVEDVLKCAIQICDALDYAHSMNVIHRDIKPENILIDSNLNVKILDFGMSKGMPKYGTHKGCGPCSLIGTVQYLPPEYIQGEQLTSISDLYSLGVTLYELLTEQLPFPEGKSNEVFYPQLFEKPVPPTIINKDISKELELILLKLLEKDPEKRFQSAREVKNALLSILITFNLQTDKIASKAIHIITPFEDKSYIEPEMVYITGGTFQMGSNKYSDEKPVHSVTLDSFYIGKYAVTNKEYCLYDPKHSNPGDDLPVVYVSWNDVIAYCKWLSEETGNTYRLPTEAEWEFACRAGTTTDYYWGDKMNGDYCWYYDNSGHQIHSVGQKKPNAFGLYDMSGNVWEWCNDSSYDPKITRAFRGGSWNHGIEICSSYYHIFGSLTCHDYDLGFRLARSTP